MTNSIQLPSTPKQQQDILPDFIIIGGMKCGTTSLHYYLNCHPEISMTSEKELNFFIQERNWDKGIEWYQSQFINKSKAKLYGEASPNYTNYPNWTATPKLMYETVPHAKLIYILRDPIERIVSQYVHKYADGWENRAITEALADFEENPYNFYVCRSCYYSQLEQYLQYFPPSNILILITEDLYRFPEKTLQSVCKFLDVSDDISLIDYQKKLHKSVYKRRKTNLGNKLAKLPLMVKISELHPTLRHPINQLIYFPFSTPVKKPELTQSLRSRLLSYLEDDINQLQKYTGREFKEWCV
jgi:hypothetical protein